jgi:sugar lactone lactonase YvrE
MEGDMYPIRIQVRDSFLFFVCLLFVLSGCVSTTPPQKDTGPIFYPEPPQAPRYQYLHSFTSSEDIEPDQSQFEVFVAQREKATKWLLKPFGVGMYDGKIYVADTNATVQVLDLVNKTMNPMEGTKGLGKVVQPINLAIDEQGTKYVADPIRGQIVVYDKNDFYIKAIGIAGVWKPVDVAVFEDRIYVVDAKNLEVRVFDKSSGELVKKIGQKGGAEERLGLPTNIAVSNKGIIYVTDAGRFQVVKYDRDGHSLGAIGAAGQNPGYFARPRGIDIDRDGRIYVADAAFDNVQVFNQEGQLLVFFGGPGRDPGELYLAADVYIDYDPKNIELFRTYTDPNFEVEYLIFVTSQFGKRLVNVYGYGKERGRQYLSEEELIEQAKKRLQEFKGETLPE